MRTYRVGIVISVFLCAALLSCTSKYTFSSNNQLFQALDAGLQRWKTLYDNADPSLSNLTERLEQIARKNRENILNSVSDGPTDHRIVAAKSLHLLKTDRTVLDSINYALNDSNPAVRENALFSVGYIRPDWSEYPDVLSDLRVRIRELARSKKTPIRVNAYYAMFGLVSSSNDRGLQEVLHKGLTDSEVSVRNQAVRAFQVLKSPSAVPDLIDHTLRDPSELVRFNTIRALRNQQDRRAIPELVNVLKNADAENPFFVRKTIDLLSDLTGRRDLTTAEDWVVWYKLKQTLRTPTSDAKIREVLNSLFSFLQDIDRMDETQTYATRTIRFDLRSLFSTVTGEGQDRTVSDWVGWFQKKNEEDRPIPLKGKESLLPNLLELLSRVENQEEDLAEEIVELLRFLSGIHARSQMNTTEEWLKWYQSNKSELRSSENN